MLYLVPTDTCYGIAGEFQSKKDHDTIYDFKNRPQEKKLSILISDWEMLKKIADIPERVEKILQNYPYPFTYVTERVKNIPDFLASQKSFGIRIASECLPKETFTDLYTRVSRETILFLTSANVAGERECYTKKDIHEKLGDFFQKKDIVSGKCGKQTPSDVFTIQESGAIQFFRKNHG